MRLFTTTLVAALVSATAVSAAPTQITNEKVDASSLVEKSQVNEVLAMIQELGQNQQKRDLAEDNSKLLELAMRDDPQLGDLISKLKDQGLFDEISELFTTDGEIRPEIKEALIKLILDFCGPLVAPYMQLFKQANVLQNFLKKVLNNHPLTRDFFGIAKYLYDSGVNPIDVLGLGKKVLDIFGINKRDGKDDYVDDSERLIDAKIVYSAIKDAGITQDVLDTALADAEASMSLLRNAFKQGLICGEDVYNSANPELLEEALEQIFANAEVYASDIAEFIGEKISSGEASVSDVDNAVPFHVRKEQQV